MLVLKNIVTSTGRSHFTHLKRGFSSEAPQSLSNTVKHYNRHVFISSPTPASEWPHDANSINPLLTKIHNEIKQTRIHAQLTVYEKLNSSGTEGLLFPDSAHITVDEASIPSLMAELKGTGQVSKMKTNKIAHIFICCHGKRDARCGNCGPPLYQEIQKILKDKKMQDSVDVYKCSHIGGHKYAGNIIIFDSQGVGDWYGYVDTKNIENLIEQHILHKKLVYELWRGRMGMSPEETEVVLSKNINACGNLNITTLVDNLYRCGNPDARASRRINLNTQTADSLEPKEPFV